MAIDPASAHPLLGPKRASTPMLGVAVVESLVDAIVSGRIAPGELLPPEGPLSEQFGVSRTVIRESVKRVEEKGLVTIARGRGTTVLPTTSWNMLDHVVLGSLITHDETLGVLDELSIVRAQLESVMAAETAARRTEEEVERLGEHLERMRAAIAGDTRDEAAFRDADVEFHHAVMAASGNRLAESIARIMLDRALVSTRYQGVEPRDSLQVTLTEHEAVYAAIAGQAAETAQQAMGDHILSAWQRRRLPTQSEEGTG